MHEETRRNERANEPVLGEGLMPGGGQDHRGNGGSPSSQRGIRSLLRVTVFWSVAAIQVVLGLVILLEVSGHAGGPQSLVLWAPPVALGAVVLLAFLSIL